MKIIINATPLLSPLTGVGNYTYSLVKNFVEIEPANSYLYYYGGKVNSEITLYENSNVAQNMYNFKEELKKMPVLGGIFKGVWRAGKHFAEKLATMNEGCDLYFEPNFIPLNLAAKRRIVTVHDLSFYLYPEWHVDETNYFSSSFFKRIKSADMIITDSESIKKEICEIIDFPNDKVEFIYCGVNHNVFKKHSQSEVEGFVRKYGLPQKFILFIGSIEPRKNLLNLIKAYSILPDYIKEEYKLVLAGFKGWRNDEIMALVNNLKNNIIYCGYLPLEELAYLYNAATVFIYPSLYEGFGLPPLEAMACGTPVIVSGISVHKEIYQGAACFCDPLQIEDIACKIKQVIEDVSLRSELSAAGLERAVLFSWEKSARQHLDVFNKALNM